MRCRSWSSLLTPDPTLPRGLSGGLKRIVAAEIAERGSIGFDRFVELALYHPELGFYSAGGRAGARRGDFITSVEVGPLFGAVVADYLDARWSDLGFPEPFRVAECGAGVATMYRTVRKAEPACWTALEFDLVETSPTLRATHDELPGTNWRSVAALDGDHRHVILANELLDNMAFGVAEKTEAGWAPVNVEMRGSHFELVPQQTKPLEHLEQLAPDAPFGARVPIATRSAEWVQRTLTIADRVIVFDYGASTAELAGRGQNGWLRTYRHHERGSDPFESVGERDITHDVPFDQLPPADKHSVQAGWLHENGMWDRVTTAKQTWRDRAHIGDLAALTARSAIGEAEALVDASGLGAFHVLEWQGSGRS